jgi:hypothetical protein
MSVLNDAENIFNACLFYFYFYFSCIISLFHGFAHSLQFTGQNQMHLLTLKHQQPYSWSCCFAVVLLPIR